MTSAESSTPVLIGGGQFTDRNTRSEDPMSPLELLLQAAERALADCGSTEAVRDAIDMSALVAPTTDAPTMRISSGDYPNLPCSVARGLGANSAQHFLSTRLGGNSPQMLVNECAERIAEGRVGVVLLTGMEALASLILVLKSGREIAWGDDPGEGFCEYLGTDREGINELEMRHGMEQPIHIYPLMETALRAHSGLSPAAHQQHLGRMFGRFNETARDNPDAWFTQPRTPEEIATPGKHNRMVGYPYTKYLNAIIRVSMSAALLMTSVGRAGELGIPENKWVYLRGCSEANDRWFVSDRENLHSSPAIRLSSQQAFDMAGISAEELGFMDIYSCFPSAVQIACNEIGIPLDDPRGLTLTGGLPYFGGPGNNYSMHGILHCIRRARANPGSFGLVTANGWYLTKHACGVYSTSPHLGRWQRPAAVQPQVDVLPQGPEVVAQADGAHLTIEGYTLVYGRKGPDRGIAIGKLDEGCRTIASIDPADTAAWAELTETEGVGRRGVLSLTPDGRNLLHLNATG